MPDKYLWNPKPGHFRPRSATIRWCCHFRW